mmetsp:Transcript_27115/g.54106  ORF Transcript_27115/g.54106 Transcript_27115/m.54106 type:complete len:99 (+) Transcript_27115:191-487(+)
MLYNRLLFVVIIFSPVNMLVRIIRPYIIPTSMYNTSITTNTILYADALRLLKTTTMKTTTTTTTTRAYSSFSNSNSNNNYNYNNNNNNKALFKSSFKT